MSHLPILILSLLSIVSDNKTFQVSNAESDLKIEGTSTLHDWTIKANNVSGSAEVSVVNGQITTMNYLNFYVAVKELESGKDAMNKNTYKAMKAGEFPKVKYEWVRNVSQQGNLMKTAGRLTVGAVTRSIYMDVRTAVGTGVSFQGQTSFNMSDYGIEPPTAVFGTIKTGDKVTIKFNVKYQ